MLTIGTSDQSPMLAGNTGSEPIARRTGYTANPITNASMIRIFTGTDFEERIGANTINPPIRKMTSIRGGMCSANPVMSRFVH